MDYRIVQTEEQKFIAVVRSFQNEIINDEENKKFFLLELNQFQLHATEFRCKFIFAMK